jgi:hypothetical protein
VVSNPKGHLECTASATSTTSIGMIAVIMSSSRTNVTDYGTGFRASRAKLADVQVSLKACDANGECTGADGPNRQSGGRAPYASSPGAVR